MNINDMIDAGIAIEGEIEIRISDSKTYDTIVLFKDDACELDYDASYMYQNVQYMFAYNDGDSTVLCFELEEE
jgi:hypothetical protein